MKYNNIVVGGGLIALSLSLFTGCGTKDIIQPVQNDRIEKNSLYVNSFDSISNYSNQKSFQLNNFAPYGYDTKTYDIKGSSILFASGTGSNYEINECKHTPFQVLALNILGAPLVLGLNLVIGGSCKHRHTFDYTEFDADAKEWVEDNDINRKLLISTYDSLISTQQREEANYNGFTSKSTVVSPDLYTPFTKLYTQYSKAYSYNPEIKKNIQDLSSLYNNELLSANVKFIRNNLTKNENIKTHTGNKINPVSYQAEVNNAFPCTSTVQCDSNMKKAILSIEAKSTHNIKALNIASISAFNKFEETVNTYKKTITTYEKTLKKETDTLLVEKTSSPNLQGIYKDTFKNKTVYYKLLSEDSVKSKAKKLDVTYQIIEMDYKNVYPSFKNKNSELFISFNPKTMTLTYENLTTKYMQVNSIDLYYNNKVYTIANNKTQNFSTELSPESRETLLVTELIEESFHKNITKKKALGTQIAFGFSVKYTVGDSTQNKTLYKRDKMSLYSLIKEK